MKRIMVATDASQGADRAVKAAAARERAQRAGVTNIETQAAWGDAATAIIEAAARNRADAIVLGRRGRGGPRWE